MDSDRRRILIAGIIEEKEKAMKVLKILVCAALAALALPLAAEHATNNMDILRDKLKSDRKLIVAHNMGLTDAEGKAFWPVYDAYMKDLAGLNKRMIDLIADYAAAYNKGPVSNADAKNLLERAFKIDADEVQLKKSYAAKLEGKVPEAKIARWVQIENKIRAAVRYDLADSIPLVE
jgi:hypothetical protein